LPAPTGRSHHSLPPPRPAKKNAACSGYGIGKVVSSSPNENVRREARLPKRYKCRHRIYSIGVYAPLAYNLRVIFFETTVFTRQIKELVDDHSREPLKVLRALIRQEFG